MGTAAAVVVVIGIIAMVWGGMQKFKAGRIAKAPFVKTGDACRRGAELAGAKGAISTYGNVEIRTPLRSPVTGTECLYYELKVTGEWKEGESTKSKDYVDDKVSADFGLNDGTGTVLIDARRGGDFEPFNKTFEETKKEGFLADLKSAVGRGEAIPFGSYAFQNPTMSKANKFTCTEYVLPVQRALFACGRAEGGVITSPKFTSLILDHRSRDELLGNAAKSAKLFLFGGAAATAAGTVLGIVSRLL